MRDPKATRQTVIEHASALFNQQGYRATSLSDITDATGLTKGAIYQHFENKETLEIEALQFMMARVSERLGAVIKAESTAPAKLRAVFRFFAAYVHNPVVAGGCPLLNAGIEADDAHPSLRVVTQQMLATLRATLERLLAKGIEMGQLKPDTNVALSATYILAMVEGGVFMSRVEGSSRDIEAVMGILENWLRTLEA